MRDLIERFGGWLAAPAVVVVGLVIGLELYENPEMGLVDILLELVELTLIVVTVAGMVYLLQRRLRVDGHRAVDFRGLEDDDD